MKFNFILFGVIFVFLFGCSQPQAVLIPTSSSNANIVSLVDFDIDLCDYPIKTQNTGFTVVFKDKNTGEYLDGYSSIKYQGVSHISGVKKVCHKKLDSQNVSISVFSKGYTPFVFDFSFDDFPDNKFATIEVSMIKSCSGGPSCFDLLSNVDKFEYLGREKEVNLDQRIQNINYSVLYWIDQQFGLNESNSDFECLECSVFWLDPYFTKGKGTYEDGSDFEFYYRPDRCSGGFSACGHDICFSSTSDAFFDFVKTNLCSKMKSMDFTSSKSEKEMLADTEEIRRLCLAGKFDKIVGNKKIISFKQIASSGTGYSVESFSFDDCLAR